MNIYFDTVGVLADVMAGLCKDLCVPSPYLRTENLHNENWYKVFGLNPETIDAVLVCPEFWHRLAVIPVGRDSLLELSGFFSGKVYTWIDRQYAYDEAVMAEQVAWLDANIGVLGTLNLCVCPLDALAPCGNIMVTASERVAGYFREHGGEAALFPAPWNRAWNGGNTGKDRMDAMTLVNVVRHYSRFVGNDVVRDCPCGR